ncbi:MAG: metallophosphoesterase [Rectinemataceae bacterium]|jgi:predicted phosphodiesterase
MSLLSGKNHGLVAVLLSAAFFTSGVYPSAFADTAKSAEYRVSCLNVTPGGTGAELNFAWLTQDAGKAIVQIAKASEKSGADFPVAKSKLFSGLQSRVSATLFNGDDRSMPTGAFADKVTATGLSDSTAYLYRVGDGKVWSDVYPIETRDQKNFGFLVAGDPQLGAKATGSKTLDADSSGWADTVSKATVKYPNASFLVSLGDEVNDYNKRELQDAEYLAYFAPPQLKGLPVATVNGNHDFQMGEYYGFHYNQPNLSPVYGISYGNDGDYWFAYGGALFLMLNSNTESAATHDVFIREAVAKNPDARWRIACFHHSIYSEAEHVTDPDVVDRRSNYVPIFDRYKIDLVLQGHDHSYTRTFQMRGGKPLTDQKQNSEGAVLDPTGTLYLTFNSGSGSKFYDWKDAAPAVYSAARWQGKVPSFGYISIAGGALTFTVHRTDDMSVIDAYSIAKTK